MSLVSKARYVVAAVAVALTLGVLYASPAPAASSAHSPTPPLLASRGLHLVPALTKKVNSRNITYYEIVNANGNSGYCLDVKSQGYPYNGDPVQLWTCNGNHEQLWVYDADNNEIKNYHLDYCLDVNSNGYPYSGDGLQLWGCDHNCEQIWLDEPVYPYFGEIENCQNAYCLDVDSHGYPYDGDRIQLWTCASPPNDEQKWSFDSNT